MPHTLLANIFYEHGANDHILWRAMPLLLGALCVLAIAYRYYSAFLAAKVAALDDSRLTPAHVFNDGQNYHPTKKWVLFGHHFAAISGAGPLIGPVLAIQYGYFPGLLWLIIGVCLAGAVQDMLVLAASVRGLELWVGCEIRAAHGPAERLPFIVVAHRDREPLVLAERAEAALRNVVRMAIAEPGAHCSMRAARFTVSPMAV